jgi:hypothetical protein
VGEHLADGLALPESRARVVKWTPTGTTRTIAPMKSAPRRRPTTNSRRTNGPTIIRSNHEYITPRIEATAIASQIHGVRLGWENSAKAQKVGPSPKISKMHDCPYCISMAGNTAANAAPRVATQGSPCCRSVYQNATKKRFIDAMATTFVDTRNGTPKAMGTAAVHNASGEYDEWVQRVPSCFTQVTFAPFVLQMPKISNNRSESVES